MWGTRNFYMSLPAMSIDYIVELWDLKKPDDGTFISILFQFFLTENRRTFLTEFCIAVDCVPSDGDVIAVVVPVDLSRLLLLHTLQAFRIPSFISSLYIFQVVEALSLKLFQNCGFSFSFFPYFYLILKSCQELAKRRKWITLGREN